MTQPATRDNPHATPAATPDAPAPVDAPPTPFQRLDLTRSLPYTRAEYARRIAWALVRTLLFRPEPVCSVTAGATRHPIAGPTVRSLPVCPVFT